MTINGQILIKLSFSTTFSKELIYR